jgi:ketosteroid isomerase-like protein
VYAFGSAGRRHRLPPPLTGPGRRFAARGTHTGPLGPIPATGKSAEVVVCDIVEIRDGKIYREREYYDQLTMMQQLGVMPAE